MDMTYNQKDVLDRIRAYIALRYTRNTYTPPKDFYNFFTGEMSCGRCGKRMDALYAIFHWHIFK